MADDTTTNPDTEPAPQAAPPEPSIAATLVIEANPSASSPDNEAEPQSGEGGEWELLGIGVPGDREIDDKRLSAALDPAAYAMLDEADFAKYPFLHKGFIGPKALLNNGIRYLVDPRVAVGTSWITGADSAGKHVVGLVAGRDFIPDGIIEAAEVRDGDPSPDGAGPLVSARGI